MKLGILGAKGRMGKMIIQEIQSGVHGVQLGGVADKGDNAEDVFKNSDAVIDFSVAEATADHAALAHQYRKPFVVGTTGLGAVATAALIAAGKGTAVFYAPNMSPTVNLLLALVVEAAKRLNAVNFDIEITEAHHRDKVDCPSGTAFALGRAAAEGRGIKLEDAMISGRTGVTPSRIPGTIGISSIRGGDVVGDHTVAFLGAGERLELTHKATDRAIFARGAIRAALWLKGKPAGFYSMSDLLGI